MSEPLSLGKATSIFHLTNDMRHIWFTLYEILPGFWKNIIQQSSSKFNPQDQIDLYNSVNNELDLVIF